MSTATTADAPVTAEERLEASVAALVANRPMFPDELRDQIAAALSAA